MDEIEGVDKMEWISIENTYLTETQQMLNAQLVVNHFVGSDWTQESLSALIGNMSHESTLNPDLYEQGYAWSANRGYGLVQWTPRSKYWDWAVDNGLPPRDGDSQLARINYEVDNNIQWIPKASNFNGLTFSEFRANTQGLTIAELTEAFMWGYERPNATAGQNSLAKRIAFAQRANDELDWSGSTQGGCANLAVLPIKYMNISQGEDGGFSHSGTLAMDFVGPTANYPYYAPFDCECIGRDLTNAIATFKSNGKVRCADGQSREIVFRCIHDENLLFNEGDLILKNELLGHTGNAGNSSGDHFHLDAWEGVTFTRTNPLLLYDVFAINGVEVINDGGYPWKVVNCSGGGGGPSEFGKGGIIELLLSDCLNGWKW